MGDDVLKGSHVTVADPAPAATRTGPGGVVDPLADAELPVEGGAPASSGTVLSSLGVGSTTPGDVRPDTLVVVADPLRDAHVATSATSRHAMTNPSEAMRPRRPRGSRAGRRIFLRENIG
jgi:hypothetical protein